MDSEGELLVHLSVAGLCAKTGLRCCPSGFVCLDVLGLLARACGLQCICPACAGPVYTLYRHCICNHPQPNTGISYYASAARAFGRYVAHHARHPHPSMRASRTRRRRRTRRHTRTASEREGRFHTPGGAPERAQCADEGVSRTWTRNRNAMRGLHRPARRTRWRKRKSRRRRLRQRAMNRMPMRESALAIGVRGASPTPPPRRARALGASAPAPPQSIH